ncbi:MAG: NADH-quinone oxidoreductase subunit J [Alphaproteobacteria bacterium]|nr:NADH-quinone oxidoreductase subunit J [Alphaproteobacteria bacterium]
MTALLQPALFYLFSAVLLGSATAVVVSRNPVHAVLFLILCFFNAAGLFLILGAEFIAFILVIVYVGAVAVLFLFVVMMLDIDFRELRRGFARYLPIGIAVGGVLVLELIVMACGWIFAPGAVSVDQLADTAENTRALGQVLYTDYFYPFQVSGIILLVAMIGAIVLTLRERKDARRQNIERQLDRKITDVIEVVKVESGKGVL